MRIIGTGAPVRIYLTRAEFVELKAVDAPTEPPLPWAPVLPIAVPAGVPVFIDDRLSEGVVLCESAGWWGPWFELRRRDGVGNE